MKDYHPLLQQLIGTIDCQSNWELTLQAIKNDIEGLLNSFVAPIEWAGHYPQLSHSVLNFGLPNYLTARYTSQGQRQHLCEQIKLQVQQHEPRLFAIDISMENDDESFDDLTFCIQINAKIHWQRKIQDVMLHSDWNPLTMSFKII